MRDLADLPQTTSRRHRRRVGSPRRLACSPAPETVGASCCRSRGMQPSAAPVLMFAERGRLKLEGAWIEDNAKLNSACARRWGFQSQNGSEVRSTARLRASLVALTL